MFMLFNQKKSMDAHEFEMNENKLSIFKLIALYTYPLVSNINALKIKCTLRN